MRKNQKSIKRKQIDSHDKKAFMTIQFILEIYVYWQR